MVTLRVGSKGEDVKRLQLLLRSALTPPPKLTVDGDFGPKTEAIVKTFQAQRSLKADGVVGPQTWAALGQQAAPKPPAADPDLADAHRKSGGLKDWMEIAEAELGIHENALKGQHNVRIVEYHQTTTLKATTDETPWCSSFVNWVMIQAGYKGTDNALARSWVNWGTKLAEPKFGAVTVIKKKNASSDQATGSTTGFHVGFFVSATDKSIRLLGGNQGDQVKYSNFKLSGYDVKAYRVP